jgi:hypothetical protein
MAYWLRPTAEEWQTNPMVRQAAEDALVEQRTIDDVAPGEQQSEAGHALRTEGGTWCGTHNGELFRTLSNRQSWMEYTLSTGLTAERIDTTTTPAPQLRLRLSTEEGGRLLRLRSITPTSADASARRPLDLEVQVPRDAAQHSSDGFTEVTLTLPWGALLTPEGTGIPELTLRYSQTEKSGFPGIFHLRMIRGEH